MKYLPLKTTLDTITQQRQSRGQRIYLSPQGAPLTQAKVRTLCQLPHLVLLCGRYEGIDERIVTNEIDEEISIGDYVLSGGELGACVIIDALVRLLPGVLNHAQSAIADSFTASLLDHPHYTRPPLIDGLAVPAVLLSGDHHKIAQWRKENAYQRTKERRPDLLSINPTINKIK